MHHAVPGSRADANVLQSIRRERIRRLKLKKAAARIAVPRPLPSLRPPHPRLLIDRQIAGSSGGAWRGPDVSPFETASGPASMEKRFSFNKSVVVQWRSSCHSCRRLYSLINLRWLIRRVRRQSFKNLRCQAAHRIEGRRAGIVVASKAVQVIGCKNRSSKSVIGNG